MQFRARLLLKVVSVLLGGLVLGLLAAIIILSILRKDSIGAQGVWVIVLVLLLPALVVLKMITDSFSVLEVDEKGVKVRKWIGGVDLEWRRIGSVRYWEQIQLVQGAPIREYFAELRSPEGRRLLRLKSSYDPAAYECLIQFARARNIQVEVSRL